ncbi:sulfotransferase family 2 domain-containing protein [Pseudooceanicola aestuarii]|uniref:sulfotransferase family 2 domain-containing protein n=1 Tax=Pseudooceanicola aestuarii TaxID=2697319 RepID=UPI0013D48ABA|nr:sulfotransferase family 2 domain-containing protein [Pseudooceanicola aestuarii]
MILSRGRNFLFIHIPKTGGTSMALALESRAMRDDLMLGDTPKAKRRRRKLQDAQTRGRLWKHSTLADLEGLVDAQETDSLFIFTLVRNPWDRLSSYYHWLRLQSFDHPAVHLSKALDFSAFIRYPAIAKSIRANPARTYLSTSAGEEKSSLYIRLERFEEDAVPLWRHLGFTLTLPRINLSGSVSSGGANLSRSDRIFISELCCEDIARFEYSAPE